MKYKNISVITGQYWMDNPQLEIGNYYRMQDSDAMDVAYIKFESERRPIFHKTDGPAYIRHAENEICFIVKGQRHIYTQPFCRAAKMSKKLSLMWVLQFGEMLPETIEEFYGKHTNDMSLTDY